MSQIKLLAICILVLGAYLNEIQCKEIIINNAKSKDQMNKEIMALSRDGNYRKNPDDDYFHGFFAAWPFVLLILSASFLVAAFIALIGHATGICRTKESIRGNYRQAQI